MAPTLRTTEEALAKREKEFYDMIKWLRNMSVPATKLRYKTLRDGSEYYEVTFAKEIFDIRDFREKSTLPFLAFGKHHTTVLGREKAAELAYYAYLASIGVPEGQHGTGELMGNYRHGDANDEFRTWPVEHFTIAGPIVRYVWSGRDVL